MSGNASAIVLWLFVINLGIAFGAGVYEHRVTLRRWIDTSQGLSAHWNGAVARQDDPGLRFWVFTSTLPLTLLTLVNLFAAWQAAGALREWWLAAAGAALADRVITFAYFIPTMVRLIDLPDSAASVTTAFRWVRLNHLRHAITLAAWLAALQAFALFHQQSR